MGNYDKLYEYIKNNLKNENVGLRDKLLELYRLYSMTEIENFKDFKESPKNFSSFLSENTDMLEEYSSEDLASLIMGFVEIKKTLNGQINSLYIHRTQKCFTDIIKDLMNKKSYRVLDVGSGVVGYSSILLGQTFDKVDLMEDYLWPSDECFKKLNVNTHREYFNKNTNIMDFDVVVGRLPCSAIDSIVYLCKKYNKKYFIEMCSCKIPSLNEFYNRWLINGGESSLPKKWNESGRFSSVGDRLNSSKDMQSWNKMLPEIDENIRFSGNYAFNIGESKKDIEMVIASHKRHEEKTPI